MSDFYLLGKILVAGRDGFVKVLINPGFIKAVEQLKIVYIDFWQQKKKFIIEEVKTSKNAFFFKFINFDDDRDTSILIKREVWVTKEEIEKLGIEIDRYSDLNGFKVYKNGSYIGIVSDFFEMPANAVIEIRMENNGTLLIPVVDSFIESIETTRKILVLNPDQNIQYDEH